MNMCDCNNCKYRKTCKKHKKKVPEKIDIIFVQEIGL